MLAGEETPGWDDFTNTAEVDPEVIIALRNDPDLIDCIYVALSESPETAVQSPVQHQGQLNGLTNPFPAQDVQTGTQSHVTIPTSQVSRGGCVSTQLQDGLDIYELRREYQCLS